MFFLYFLCFHICLEGIDKSKDIKKEDRGKILAGIRRKEWFVAIANLCCNFAFFIVYYNVSPGYKGWLELIFFIQMI